ncbi:hypothetical protein ACLOAV_002052 [Pseudogymnoascus australis]
MGDLLPQSWRCDSIQRGPSIAGVATASPLSPNRQSLTSVNASPSSKKPTHRTKRRFLENITHRTKCAQVSTVDGADVGRSSSPRQQQSINHGPNNGLWYSKAVFSRAATSSRYSLSALQGSKSPMPSCSATGSVIPQKASKFSHLNHLSVTKTPELVPNTLLASKSFKDLQPIVTDLPRITAEENVTGLDRHNKRGCISHDSAIPIPLGDLLLRSPRSEPLTEGQGLCGKVDGPVLEGLIGIQGKDIEPLCPWDDADSQVDTEADDKNPPPTVPGVMASTVLGPVLESSDRGFTEVKFVVGKAHNENSADGDSNNNDCASSLEGGPSPERNGYEHRGSQTTNQALSDTPESETSQSNGGGSFGTSGYGDAPSFTCSAPSRNGGNNSQKRDRNELAVGSGKDLRPKTFSPLPLTCWYAAKGYPCCNGKGHGSPEVRRLLSDHFRSKKSPNHHLLFEECQLCERLFINESSWEEHKKLLKSGSCRELDPADLNAENYGPNQRGISPARMGKVDEAVDQYKKDRSYNGCTKTHHDAWINDNYRLYIGKSGVAEEVARYELGKWLVAWYAMFPGEEIPSNPFTKNNHGSLLNRGFLDRVYRGLAKRSQIGSLPALNYEQCSIIAEIYGNALSTSELLQIDAAQSPKAKRVKTGASEATKVQQQYTVDPALLLPPTPAGFEEDSTVCGGSSLDDAFIDPKLWDDDGQTDEGRPENDPNDFTFLGSHFGNQIFAQDGVTDSSSQGLREHLAPIQQYNQSH